LLSTVACLAVAVGTFTGAGVHTALATTISDPCGNPSGSDTIDPLLTQNKLTAIPNATRPYADICTVTTARSGTGTATAIDYTVTVAAPIPSFPVASNGDLGVNFEACVDVDSTSPLATGPTVVGHGHHGTPIYDGPYNSNNGWKVCASMSIQAPNNIVDCALSIFDPVGQYGFFDSPQLANLAACSYSGSSLTFHFPLTWQVKIPVPQAPLQGIARVNTYPWILGTANNLVVESQVYLGVTLPIAVCVPSPTCSIVGPITGVGGLLFTVDWTPGTQLCPGTIGVSPCTDNPGGFTLGLLPLGYPVSAVQSCDPANLQATCPTPIAGTVPYDWCKTTSDPNGQDVGDLYAVAPAACSGALVTPYPYHYETVNGRTIPNAGGQQIPPQFLPSGVSA
jgi:hypothetical protein